MSTLYDFRLPPMVRTTYERLSMVIFTREVKDLELIHYVVDGTETFIRSLAPGIRLAILAGSIAFDLMAAGLPSSRGRTFNGLDLRRAEAYFDLWWHAKIPPFHDFAKGIKSLLAIPYYEHPEIQKHLGYEPEPWIAEVTRKRMERWGAEIQKHQELLTTPDPLIK